MNTLFDIFSKYGWEGVLAIAICIFLFLIGNYLNKKITGNVTKGLEKVGENLTNQLSNQNDKLINTIVEQQEKMLDHFINKDVRAEENHNNMLNERIELSEDINMSLRDIMNIHNAQRAFIIEFHNSYKNLSGVPFAKYSCIYEWFDKGLGEIASKIIGLPFSNMAKIVSDILKTKEHQIVYEDMIKMEEENPSLFSILKDTRTKGVVYTAMYDRNNILIGMLVLEYQIPIEDAHLNLGQLKIQTAELTSLLNIRYKYLKK